MRKLLLCFALAGTVALIIPAYSMPAGMSEVCKKEYRNFQKSPAPKAFAKGVTNGCGWRGGEGMSLDEAKKGALRVCSIKGNGCKVVESKRR